MEEVTRLTSRLQHKTHGQLEPVVRIYMESQSKVDAMEVAIYTGAREIYPRDRVMGNK